MTDRTVTYRLRAELGQFHAQMTQASASTKKLAGDLTSMDKSSVRTRQSLTAFGGVAGRVGLVAAGGLAASAKAAIDWESAWAGVQKTVDGTATEMAKLEEGLRELARTMPATHQEIAATAEAAGQLGVARDDIVDFTETMIQLAETTNLTADEAATSIAQMANVMQTAPEDIDNLGAALVALGNDGASTERDIIQMAQRISGAGAQIGLAEADILAIANAAASMGIEVEAGGSAISRVFTELAKATASGGPKLDAFASTAGLTADEFTRLFESAPAEAFAAFTTGLDRINKSGGDVFATLDDLGLEDIRVSRALLSMAASGDLLNDSLALGAESWEQNTALQEEFAKRAGTTAAEMQVAWNNVKDAGIELGATLLPILSSAADSVSAMASAFGSLPGPVKSFIGGALGVTSILGGGLWFTAKTINGISEMRDAFKGLDGSAGGASRTLKGFAVAGGALAGIGLLTTALSLLSEKSRESAASIEEWNTSVEAALEAGDLAAARQQIADIREEIKQYEQDLNSGFLGGVRDALSFMGPEQGSENTNLGQQRKALEELEAQLEEASLAANSATSETDAFAVSSKNAGTVTQRSAEQVELMEKALKEQREAARESATSFVNLGDSLDDGKTSLREWIKELEDQADALINFQRNAREAGEKGLDKGLIRALNEAGEAGALRMRQLANATDEEIERANEAWRRGQHAIDDFVDATAKVPKNKSTTVTVASSDAMAKLREFQQLMINATKPRTARLALTLLMDAQGHQSLGGIQRAQGGPVYGPGSATSDSIPAWLSNGEFVIKAAAVQKYGTTFFQQLNAMRFADGGFVSRTPAPAVNVTAGQSIDYARLANELARVRPVYGDVTLMPHNYEDFKREMMHDRQRAGLGGI